MNENKMVIALLEEYERSTIDLKEVLSQITLAEFVEIRDSETEDPDCTSIQTVMTHTVRAGYTYANYVNTISNIKWGDFPTL